MSSIMEDFEHLTINMEDILLATDKFSPNKLIGRGGFGQVYKGELSLPMGPTVVACKRLDRRLGQGNIEFWKEILMLSKCSHKNLVSLLHFCIEGDERVLVYEYASRGSLDRYVSDTALSWNQRLAICIGVAHALKYLHDPMKSQQRIIHRDIKSSNILLAEDWTAKVSDFGLSKIGPANQPLTYLVSHAVGTVGYCDPLYWEMGFLSKESDVYSLGVVLFEVMCGRLCCEYLNGQLISILVHKWKACCDEKKLDDIIFQDLKDQINWDSLITFSTIANRCLNRDRRERPMMDEVVKELEVALKQQLLSININEDICEMYGERFESHTLINSSQPILEEFNAPELGNEPILSCKNPRLRWCPELHKRFVDAVAQVGYKNASPKIIMQVMGVKGLTRKHVASHLQLYRANIKKMRGRLSSGNAGDAYTGDPAIDH